MSGGTHVALRTWHADSEARKASEFFIREELIDSVWFHPKTGHLYRITGLGFDSQRERWMIKYRPAHADDQDETKDFDFCHLPEDFFLEGRFMRVRHGE